MEMMKQILLADRNDAFRLKLQQLIEPMSSLQMAGSTGDCAEVLELLAHLQPDALVLDLLMDTDFKILSQLPRLSPNTKCLVTCVFAEDALVEKLATLGVCRLIRKPCCFEWLLERIAHL